jgi:hypothetical protein
VTLPRFVVRHPFFLFAETSTSEVSPPVPPKGDLAAPSVRFRSKKKRDRAADDKDINLRPSARNGSSPPPSAPGGVSSTFCGPSTFFSFRYDLNLRSFPTYLCRSKTTRQLLLCVFFPRRNETGTRKAAARCGPPFGCAELPLKTPKERHPPKAFLLHLFIYFLNTVLCVCYLENHVFLGTRIDRKISARHVFYRPISPAHLFRAR